MLGTQSFQHKLQLFRYRNVLKYPESFNFPELMPNVQFSPKPRLCEPRLDLLLGPTSERGTVGAIAHPTAAYWKIHKIR
jgi:hypothetical protein